MPGHQRLPTIPTATSTMHLITLLEVLPSLSITARKSIMTAVRVGMVPAMNSTLRKSIATFLRQSHLIHYNSGVQLKSGYILFRELERCFNTRVRRGLVSIYLRTVPYIDENDWVKELEAGKAKELQTTQSYRPPHLQYPFFLQFHHAIRTQMHPDIPLRPAMSLLIRKRFLEWKAILSSTILIPTPSDKSLGFHSSYNFGELIFGHLAPHDRPQMSYTTAQMEAEYSESGRQVVGPCEVRYAWKYNDLKPRVYYAQGASAYFSSRHIRPIFNLLQSMFANTDPNRRYSFSRFRSLDSKDRFTVYDYSSFTSNLSDISQFVAEMAEFCEGTRVRIFDTYYGVQEVSLKSLLNRYNAVCNIEPEFSIHKIEGLSPYDPDGFLRQRQAGLLGVYGNITESTILHGLLQLMITGSEDKCNALGDDGGVVTNEDELPFEELKAAIRVLGKISDDRFQTWMEDEGYGEDAEGWHFVKRPISRVHGRIMQDWMPDFQNFGSVLDIQDSMHTLPHEPFERRRRLLIRQTCRLFESCHRHKHLLTEEDIEDILSITTQLFLRLHLPLQGSFPTRSRSLRSHSCPDSRLCSPPVSRESLEEGWYTVLRNRVVDVDVLNLPAETHIIEDLPHEMIAGMEFKSNGSEMLGLLEKIGVVVKSLEVVEWLATEEAFAVLDALMTHSKRAVYTFTVCRTYPQWTSYFDATHHVDSLPVPFFADNLL